MIFSVLNKSTGRSYIVRGETHHTLNDVWNSQKSLLSDNTAYVISDVKGNYQVFTKGRLQTDIPLPPPQRNFDLYITILPDDEFSVELHDPQSGDHCRATFNEKEPAEFKDWIANEVLSWVSIMRDEEDAAKHCDDEYDYNDAYGDVINFLSIQPDSWYVKYGRTKQDALGDALLIVKLANEQLRLVARDGNDRETAVEFVCEIAPGIQRDFSEEDVR